MADFPARDGYYYAERGMADWRVPGRLLLLPQATTSPVYWRALAAIEGRHRQIARRVYVHAAMQRAEIAPDAVRLPGGVSARVGD